MADLHTLTDKTLKDRGKAIHEEWAGLIKGSAKTATKRAYQATQLPAQLRTEAVPTGAEGDGSYSRVNRGQ